MSMPFFIKILYVCIIMIFRHTQCHTGGGGTERQCLWVDHRPNGVSQAGAEDSGPWYASTQHALHSRDVLHLVCLPGDIIVQGEQEHGVRSQKIKSITSLDYDTLVVWLN